MLRYLKYTCVLSVCALTGCASIYGTHGVIQNRDTDYLNSNQIAALSIPPGLSSSKIQAHYPVSERDYPESTKKVDLLPPELPVANAAAPLPAKMTTYNDTADAARQVGDGHSRSQVLEPVTPLQQHQAASHYYDPYTRSATGGVGKPIRSALSSVLPSGKKTAQPQPSTSMNGERNTNQSPVVRPNSDNTPTPAKMSSNTAAVQPVAAPTHPQTAAANVPTGTTLRTIVDTIWPWSKKNAAPAAGTQTASNESVIKQNDSGNTAAPTGKMYYDRYTKR